MDRGSEWHSLRRCLIILRRLQLGAATAEELIKAVLEQLGPEAYPESLQARRAAFKHDRENLRYRLEAVFYYDPCERKYILEDAGPYGRVCLSDESLRGLNLLSRDFANQVGEKASIRALLDEIVSRLDPDVRRRLESHGEAIILDLRQDVDKGVMSQRVWDCVRRATERRLKLSFNYLSPRYANGLAVYYEVAPLKVVYQEGHWYLRAWSLRRCKRDQMSGEVAYRRFRLNYILDDERLQVWPTMVSSHYRRPPRFLVHYRLKPEIGRGEISYHFEEVQITREADGSAEVRGFTDDVWEAGRLLLGYGEGCVVLGGDELVEEMRRRVRGMAENYGLLDE